MGEVHALMGENGAGKSTLMKILTGSFDDYTGTIRIGGKEVRIHSPAAAKEQGIGMVYQELSLARPDQHRGEPARRTAARRPLGRVGRPQGACCARRGAACELVGLDLDPRKTVEEISQHEAQLVEIAKVLGNHPCILMLDEPTSSLSRDEVRRLFEIIRDLRDRGLAIVYISHHLPEVFEIADRVTVMRDGRKIGTQRHSRGHAAVAGADDGGPDHRRVLPAPRGEDRRRPCCRSSVSRATASSTTSPSTLTPGEILGRRGLVRRGPDRTGPVAVRTGPGPLRARATCRTSPRAGRLSRAVSQGAGLPERGPQGGRAVPAAAR